MATEQSAVELVDDDVVGRFARAALLVALLGAVAPISIPVPVSPAPFTLQVLFVFLAGLVLGPVWGTFSMVLYLTAGAVGLPIFAGMEAGVGVLFADSGGFLWSYPFAAALIGLLVHRGTGLRDPATVSLPLVVAALLAATALIYAMGAAYIAFIFELSIWEAIVGSVLPFVPGEIVKMAAAIAIVRSGRLSPRQR